MTAALAQAGWHAAACADTAMPTGLSAVAPAGWPHRRAARLCSRTQGRPRTDSRHPARRVDPDIRANASTALRADTHTLRIGVTCHCDGQPGRGGNNEQISPDTASPGLAVSTLQIGVGVLHPDREWNRPSSSPAVPDEQQLRMV